MFDMLRSLYSGVSGLRGFQTKLDVIGNNIANVNTVGFKASTVTFKDMLSQTVRGVTAPADGRGGVNPMQIGLGVQLASIHTIHTGGSAMTTNNVLDLRIDGDGFFAVIANEEQDIPYLTRLGSFTIDANRQLVTHDGYLVLSTDEAPIQLEVEWTSIEISQTGEIIAKTEDGETINTDTFIGLINVINPSGLEKIGNSLYQMTPNAVLEGEFEIVEAGNPEMGTGAIISGQLEMSNVDLTTEFTEMIIAQRGFQANSRIITTSDEVLQELVNLKR